MPYLDDKMNKCKEVMVILGFSEASATEQLNKLLELIGKKVANRLLEEKNIRTNDLESAEGIRDFLNANYQKEELRSIIQEESEKTFDEYFSTITKDCDGETLQKAQAVLNTD